MRPALALGLMLGILGTAALCAADPVESSEPGKVTLPVFKIVGRVMQPSAAIEVNRLRPALGVRDLDRSFLAKTEAAVRADPF